MGANRSFTGENVSKFEPTTTAGRKKVLYANFFLSQRNKGGSHCVEKQGGISRFQNQLSKGNPR
jgi:hypothetical protein